MFEFVVVLPWK